MRKLRSRLTYANAISTIAAVGALAVLGGTATPASAADPYVALGDSYSVGFGASSPATTGFVGLFYSDYQSSLGASELLNRGQNGATSTTLRNGVPQPQDRDPYGGII